MMMPRWNEQDVVKVPAEAIPELGFDIIISFDEEGASKHGNHKSLLLAVTHFVNNRSDLRGSVSLYALKTRKIVSLLAALQPVVQALAI